MQTSKYIIAATSKMSTHNLKLTGLTVENIELNINNRKIYKIMFFQNKHFATKTNCT